MIFEVHESVVVAAENNDINAIEFLKDLSSYRKRGKLSIKCTKPISNRIIQMQNISEEVKGVFTIERENYTFSKSIFSTITGGLVAFHSNITTDINTKNNKIDISNYDKDLSIQELVSRRVLFVEDEISDGTVFMKIVGWFLRHLNFDRTHQISIDIRNGGGNRIHQIYTKYDLVPKQGVFGVVDCDKKSENCPLGKTAVKTIQAFKNSGYQENLKILDVSEVENLIPLGLYHQIANQSQLPLYDFLTFLVQNKPNAYYFFDYKNSFSVEKIFLGNCEIAQYWNPIFTGYPCPIVQGKIADPTKYRKDKLVNGWSSLIPLVIEALEGKSIEELEIPPYLLASWEDLGSWLLPKCIAAKPIRI